MDEQNDQAVIEIEETEADTDTDYLSILREMQQGLNVEQKSSTTDETIDNQAENLTVEPASENVASVFPAEDLGTKENVAAATEENEQAIDYSAEAATQPLPQLSTDFNGHPMPGYLAADELTDEPRAGTTDDSTNNSIVAAEDSFSSTIAPFEAVEQTDFEEDTNLVETDYQSFDDSFDNFPEISPILFDASEQPEVAEPDFDLETSAEAPTEMTSETSPNNFLASLSETELRTTPETLDEDSAGTSDEMPTNLAFGEMFAHNLNDSVSAFMPPVEIEEEAEAAFAYSPENFTDENLPEFQGSEEQSASNIEQSLDEQDFQSNLLEKQDETSANDETADFALPEAMLFAAGENDSLPQPSFALQDAEQETANERMEEPDLSELSAEDSNTEDSGLAVPWFLQAELAAKSSIAEADFPEPSLVTEDFSEENVQTLQSASPDEALIAPSLVAENTETLETDYVADALIGSENDFDEFSAPSQAEEMPTTAFAEETSETASPESFADQNIESHHPEDLPENFLAAPVENEFADLPESFSDEAPETQPLLDDADAETLEADLVGFDAPPAPDFEEVKSSLSEQPAGLALTASEQSFVDQNGSQARHNVPQTVSFLKERFVIFKIDDTLYAFPAVNVSEIGQLLPITPLPFVPSWFLGISNLRGNLLSVIGLRELWKKSSVPPHKAKILILHSEKQALTVGLVVDAVREMRHVTPEEIVFDESQSESQFAPYQIGMAEYDGEGLYLLNAENLLETLKKITVNYY